MLPLPVVHDETNQGMSEDSSGMLHIPMDYIDSFNSYKMLQLHLSYLLVS